jgi:hypothetical protein
MSNDITVLPSFDKIKARDKSVKEFLYGILAGCDLPKDLHDRAVKHYKEKTEHLKSCPALRRCEVVLKLQGSNATGTTTPPPSKKKGEYDVDLLIAIEGNCSQFDPYDLHRDIGEHLKLEYKRDLSKIRLGWMIDRAFEERLHFDIVPAVRTFHATQGPILSATVWEDRIWKQTNPEAYAARFLALAEREPLIQSEIIAMANEGMVVIANRQYEPKVEPMLDHTYDKRLLQRVVQLTKRHRDLWFLKRSDNGLKRRPPSIVITTLMWYNYERYVADKTFATLTDVLQVMARGLTDQSILIHEQVGAGVRYRLPNPTLPEENLVAKWNTPTNRRDVEEYFQWAREFQRFIEALAKMEGRHLLSNLLSDGLGKEYVQPVFDKITLAAAPLSPSRSSFGYKPGLGIITGIGSALPLAAHTNHGIQ